MADGCQPPESTNAETPPNDELRESEIRDEEIDALADALGARALVVGDEIFFTGLPD